MQVTLLGCACMTASIGFTVDFILAVLLLWSSSASQLASGKSHRDRL